MDTVRDDVERIRLMFSLLDRQDRLYQKLYRLKAELKDLLLQPRADLTGKVIEHPSVCLTKKVFELALLLANDIFYPQKSTRPFKKQTEERTRFRPSLISLTL